MSCATCRHFEQHERDDAAVGARVKLSTGRCRRYPPQVVFDPRITRTGTSWPVTRLTDGCGEYARRAGSPEGEV